jgi:hypothetical protein
MRHWSVMDTKRGIVITCRGHDKTTSVDAAVQVFDELARLRSTPFAVIADLREMTGYQTHSRKAWQAVFRTHRARMQALVLVGARSALVRMGAAAVGAFAGVPVRFVEDWQELERMDAQQRARKSKELDSL